MCSSLASTEDIIRPAGRGTRSSGLVALGLGAGSSIAVAGLPMFLLGAVASDISDDLALTATDVGIAVAAFWAGAAVLASRLGRLVDTRVETSAIRFAVTVSGTACLGMSVLALDRISLAAWMALAGGAFALVQPAANRLLVDTIGTDQLGLGFGITQSAPSVAGAVAGFSVPLAGHALGWRMLFVATAVLALIVALALGRAPMARPLSGPAPSAERPPDRATIWALRVALSLGSVGAVAVPTFYVDAATETGSGARAGIVIAVASLAVVGVKVLSGLACDRLDGGQPNLYAAMLIMGAAGSVLLATGWFPAMALGVALALAGTSGAAAVFWFVVIYSFPQSPGSITGAVMSGGLIGATAGPILFGRIADASSYRVAWLLLASLTATSGPVLLYGTRLVTTRSRTVITS